MFKLSRVALVAALAFTLTACSSSEPDPPPPPPPGTAAPTFSIASVVVPFGDGTQGLQFAATPNADVRLIRVDIRNPLGNNRTFSPQNAVQLQGETVALQNDDEAYVRVSGTWNFRFVGARAAGGQETFDVTVPLDVSAFAPEQPSN